MEVVKYFGNTAGFAIRYEPHYIKGVFQTKYARCHFTLNGQVIGLLEEPCYIGTWIASLQQQLYKLKSESDKLYHSEFDNRTDEEIYALLCKANQLDEEYIPEFRYLPTLNNSVWANCFFAIDETIDAYMIFMIAQRDVVKFLWKAWREPSPDQAIDKLYSVEVDRQDIINTMQIAIDFLKQKYFIT